MKSFLKYILATVVGLFIFSILWIILFLGIVGIALSGSDTATNVKPNSVFELELKGILIERNNDDFANAFMGKLYFDQQQIALNNIISAIDKAATQKNIKGIFLKIDNFQASIASIEEIYNALKKFKQSGKFIVSYGDFYGNGTYYLSSISDKIYLNTEGVLALTGVNITGMFFKNLMDKVGIKMQIFKVGTFKSAVEPFTQNNMSEANRLQLSIFTNSIWGEITNTISENRKISVASIETYVNSGAALGDTKAAIDSKLADSLLYLSDMKQILEKRTGKDYNTLYLKDIVNIKDTTISSKNQIAVVYAVGEISDNGSSTENINAEELAKSLIKLSDDDKVKAVVMRVNSPGGSAFGSEQIWHAAKKVKEKKPLVVSMGDYAASGGYYISCNADRIFAQPTTLTGSIGIFGIIPDMEGIFKKIGIGFDNVKTNKYSDFGSVYRPMTEEEKLLLQKYVEKGYNLFTKRCADGRKTSQDEIKKIAEGRIYSGKDALKIGLIDELGGLDKAIEYATKKANIKDYKLKYYPTPKTMMEQIMETFSMSLETSLIKSKLGDSYEIFDAIQKSKNRSGIQAFMPYQINIK